VTVTRASAVWHVLVAWRDDVPTVLSCRSCGVPIKAGDTYRVAGIHVLCTLRPFCPDPGAVVIAKDRRRPVWKRRRRLIAVGRPPRRPSTRHLPLATCRCGRRFRQHAFKGRPQQACSRACTYRLLEARAAERRHRDCAVCGADFTFLSAHPNQATCSPSCGARLRERRKREARAAA
jgi:predicted nucleic acid-binding Zn ribbon protein